MSISPTDWRAYLRPRAALLAGLLLLILGSFAFSVVQATLTLREASSAQLRLAQSTRTARDAQRLEFLAAELNGWLSSYALDVSLGGSGNAAQNVYAQSFGATLSEMTALLGDLRARGQLNQAEQEWLRSLTAQLTQLNVLDGQIRDAYARGTPAGNREGTALVRGEAFTSYQALASSASALSRRVVENAEMQAQQAERVAVSGGQRMLLFTLAAGTLLLLLSALVVEVLRKREQVVQQLRDLAQRDGLTGVANRRRWDELLEQQAGLARRLGTPLSVTLLDLDHFKAFNDTHGHQAGDDQLRHVAQFLTQRLDGKAVVARYGGEEFGLLFPGCTPGQVRMALDALRPDLPGQVTFSAGVAQLQPHETPGRAVKRADVALYAAKRAGRAHTMLADDVNLNITAPDAAAGKG